MRRVYCDESGYTGNNLYSKDQPHFVYASVSLEPEEAKELIEKASDVYRLSGEELKGKRITKHKKGKAAALWLIEQIGRSSSAICSDKMYALSGKLYEYIFEPVLARQSSIFYGIEFHRFIADVLYVHLITKQTHAEELLSNFELSMRKKDFQHIDELFSPPIMQGQMSDFIRDIMTFAVCHRDKIVEELEGLRGNIGAGTWVLELSMTALHGILAKWGEDGEQLDVYCDSSKPLAAQSSFFDMMIGRQDRQYISFGGKKHLYTYNLYQKVQFADSVVTPGIQLADILAGSLAFSLKNRDDLFSEQCLNLCVQNEIIHPHSIFTTLEYADITSRAGFVNAMLLKELMRRTLVKEDLFVDIVDFIRAMHYQYPEWRRKLST